MTNNNKIVLFVDILGFAQLTESHSLDINLLKQQDRLFSHSLEMIIAASKNQLISTFSKFHYSLKWALDIAKMKYPLTAITFSDSSFIATTYAHEAVNIAIGLQQSLLGQKIPARMGIAYGSFAALRFRSDVSGEDGDHAAQFLGTAVVRAHAAETCGIKGFRILLHPSIIPLLDDKQHNPESVDALWHPMRYLECPEGERANKADVRHEIDYWHLKTTEETKVWHSFQDMWKVAPQSENIHYEATAKAINRMRINQGHDPLKNLRRRTIPRKIQNSKN
jgi:hypothetical protein